MLPSERKIIWWAIKLFVGCWFTGTFTWVLLENLSDKRIHLTIWEMIPVQVDAVVGMVKILWHSIAGW